MTRLSYLFCFLYMLVSGCGASVVSDEKGGGDDSSTHWLSRCVSDSVCGDLKCLCGVCSKGCQRDAACDSLSQSAVCSDLIGCDDSPMMCTKACDSDSECASGTCSVELCAGDAADSVGPDSSQSPDGGPVLESRPERVLDGGDATTSGGDDGMSSGGASSPSPNTPEPESPVTTTDELCASLDLLLGTTFDVDLDGRVEARQVSTGIGCEDDAGAPVCCNWTWTAYVVPCPDGDVVLTTEDTPFGVATAESADFDNGIGPFEVTLGCQGMDCDPTCVPESGSEIRLVRATLEPSDGGFVIPGDAFEEFDGVAALVILEDLGAPHAAAGGCVGQKASFREEWDQVRACESDEQCTSETVDLCPLRFDDGASLGCQLPYAVGNDTGPLRELANTVSRSCQPGLNCGCISSFVACIDGLCDLVREPRSEADLDLCSVDASDCTLVPHNGCCGPTQRAVNASFVAAYEAHPEWQSAPSCDPAPVECTADTKMLGTACITDVQTMQGRCQLYEVDPG